MLVAMSHVSPVSGCTDLQVLVQSSNGVGDQRLLHLGAEARGGIVDPVVDLA